MALASRSVNGRLRILFLIGFFFGVFVSVTLIPETATLTSFCTILPLTSAAGATSAVHLTGAK